MNKKLIKLSIILLSGLLASTTLFGCSNATPVQPDQDDIIVDTTPTPEPDNQDEVVVTDPVATPTPTPDSTPEPSTIPDDSEKEIDSTQKNSIIMLNYLTVLTQEIINSSNSRIFLEDTYSALISNTHPNAIDSRTLSELNYILDTLENYRMTAVKRERLQYLYEQKKAQDITKAIPNPLSVMSAIHSVDFKKTIASLIYMAIDSYTSYAAASSSTELEFLQEGWKLDDEASRNLHARRKDSLNYMVEIVHDYDLQGDLSLTEETVSDFVEWTSNKNPYQRIEFLEKNQDTYKAFGGYWLALAENYYTVGNYEACLNAIDEYEELNVSIFRNDYDYAKSLTLAIISAEEALEEAEYVSRAEKYCTDILENIKSNDWSSKYFVAQTYIGLYTKTSDKQYLTEAYELVLDNVNTLLQTQKELNAQYLAETYTVEIPIGATKEVESEIKAYNKILKEKRKTELPPVYIPLAINCDILFLLMDELDVAFSEKQRVDRILHSGEDSVFLVEQLDALYSLSDVTISISDLFEMKNDSLIIPVKYLSEDRMPQVTVISNSIETKFEDYSLNSVTRKDPSDIQTFCAKFTSASSAKYKYKDGDIVRIDIKSSINENDILSVEFAVKENKYLNFISSISFERITK